jgi:hypothetical protein
MRRAAAIVEMVFVGALFAARRDAGRHRRDGLGAEYQEQLSWGKFTAVFLIQCLEAIGTQSLRLSVG